MNGKLSLIPCPRLRRGGLSVEWSSDGVVIVVVYRATASARDRYSLAHRGSHRLPHEDLTTGGTILALGIEARDALRVY